MTTQKEKRFLIVTGKGGVGKTTICAAMASALAARGKRVLVAMCRANEHLSTMFGSKPIGAEVQTIHSHISAVNMDPEKAIEEYGLVILKSPSLYKLIFKNTYLIPFFRAVPGLYDWALLGKAWWHTTETRPDGSWKYDVVLLDAPATGHGLDMLRVPYVILQLAPPGLLRRDAEKAIAFLQNSEHCSVVLVTLPEEMPVTETIELAHSLDQELHIPIDRVVVNSVLNPLFSIHERDTLTRFDKLVESSAAAAVLLAGQRRAIREQMQADCIERLSKELSKPQIYLPFLFENVTGPLVVEKLAELF